MKGSQQAILNFIDSDNFPNSINSLIKSAGAEITVDDVWKPIGFNNKKESTLATFLKDNFNPELGENVLRWWVTHGTRSPNWDLISTCTINGKRGILLVEAKAHKSELKKAGKKLTKDASENSKENHKNICNAIDQANTAINKQVEEVCISRDKCYQLSNRVAHAWWLASQGIPVVLLYLGFLNCKDMENGTRILFKTDEDWQSAFIEHAKMVGVDKILKKEWVDCGESKFITICRSH